MSSPADFTSDGTYYDGVAATYDATRRAADFILARVRRCLPSPAAGLVLDVGCGTGNYTHALAAQGYRCVGIDRSPGMLRQARSKSKEPAPAFALADSGALPVASGTAAAVVCVFALHHFAHAEAVLRETYRILKPGGKACWFTFDTDQVATSWLVHYFPGLIEADARQATAPGWLETQCQSIGFRAVEVERVLESEYGEGCMMYVKHHPERVLDSGVRTNISGFGRLPTDAVAAGVSHLESDLAQNRWKAVASQYEAQNRILGDYLFVSVLK